MHGKAKWPLFWHKQAFSWPLDQHRRLAPLRWLSAATVGLRVDEDHEILGLDLSRHGEEGYCGESPESPAMADGVWGTSAMRLKG